MREKIGGFTFIVRPTVFNPVDFISSRIFADFVLSLDLNGRTIMDMGCGSGIISIFAASKGASCLAVDINPIAVRSVKESADINHLADRITAFESDLFESVPIALEKNPEASIPSPSGRVREGFITSPSGRVREGFITSRSGEGSYEVIFFNPPYYKGVPKNNFERAFKAGPDLEVISKFLMSAKKYLMPGGLIYFIVSSDMDMNDLKKRINENGFGFEIHREIKKTLETFYIIESVTI